MWVCLVYIYEIPHTYILYYIIMLTLYGNSCIMYYGVLYNAEPSVAFLGVCACIYIQTWIFYQEGDPICLLV